MFSEPFKQETIYEAYHAKLILHINNENNSHSFYAKHT